MSMYIMYIASVSPDALIEAAETHNPIKIQ